MNTLAASTIPGEGNVPFNFPSFSGFEEMLSEISSYSEAEPKPSAATTSERPTKRISHKRNRNQRHQAVPDATSNDATSTGLNGDFIPGISGDTSSLSSLLFDE